MATDIFLDLTGIPGESKKPGYVGEIDVLTWVWGAGHTDKTVSYGQGGGVGMVTPYIIAFTKRPDVASNALARAAATGAPIEVATMTVVDTNGGAVVLLATMQDVRVATFERDAAADGGMVERGSLEFTSFTTKSAAHANGPAPGATIRHSSGAP